MQTVSIPRLKCSVPSEAVDGAIMYAVQELGYDRATPEQLSPLEGGVVWARD